MKLLIDVDALQKEGLIAEPVAQLLRKHAVRETGSTAINILLALGALCVAGGLFALIPHMGVAALIGLAFILLGALITKRHGRQWGKLGGIWMVVGALILSGAAAAFVNQPLEAALAAAVILCWVGVMARSRLLIALVPFALASAIGGSTGYWHACYELDIEEPTVTVIVFSLLALAAWNVAGRLQGFFHDAAIIFARVCVILVNLGFWIGSLWGDTPGHSWQGKEMLWMAAASDQAIRPWIFSVAWGLGLLFAALWGVKHARRFMVNTAAVFASIHLYTQWFEHLGAEPLSVIMAGLASIAIGLGLWRYNRAQLS